jgi:hypothetical protein
LCIVRDLNGRNQRATPGFWGNRSSNTERLKKAASSSTFRTSVRRILLRRFFILGFGHKKKLESYYIKEIAPRSLDKSRALDKNVTFMLLELSQF